MKRTAPPPCPICDSKDSRLFYSSPRVVAWKCRRCHHQAVEHLRESEAKPGTDIHEQYDQGEFVAALRETRIRQADKTIGLLEEMVSQRVDLAVDFGSGRGWLLERLQKAGATRLAGADISPLAIAWMKERGIEVAVIGETAEIFRDSVRKLSFDPQFLFFMDVIEHFPVNNYRSLLSDLIKACPRLKWLIIKVPVSSGILFRIATLAARLGWTGYLERLYQVNSLTPHFHYFSKHSLTQLSESLGFTETNQIGDLDFEVSSFSARLGVSTNLLTIPLTLMGRLIQFVARILSLEDSLIIISTYR